MHDNIPIDGCEGCSGTAGRLGCPKHSPNVSNNIISPFRCPICGGNGLVPTGFYEQTSGQWSVGSAEPEKCRSCDGTGMVWH